MAFRIIRQRKEARRLAKIEEIFAVIILFHRVKQLIIAMLIDMIAILRYKDRDKLQRGKLKLEQVQDVYRIYQV